MVRGERSGHARKCKKDGTTNGRHPLAEKFAHKRPKFGLPAQVKDERVHAILVLVALGRLLRAHDDRDLPLYLDLFGDDRCGNGCLGHGLWLAAALRGGVFFGARGRHVSGWPAAAGAGSPTATVGQRASRRIRPLHCRLLQGLQLVHHCRYQTATHGLQLPLELGDVLVRVEARDKAREVNLLDVLAGAALPQALQERARCR